MSNLSNREIRTIKALAEIIIPQGGPFPLGYNDINLISFFEEFLSRVPVRVKLFLFFNLWIFEYFSWISLLYCTSKDFEKNPAGGKTILKNIFFWLKTPGIFSRMKFAYREKIILKMRGNRYFAIHGIYLLTSIVMLLSFYSDERAMDFIGYSGYKEKENKSEGG